MKLQCCLMRTKLRAKYRTLQRWKQHKRWMYSWVWGIKFELSTLWHCKRQAWE